MAHVPHMPHSRVTARFHAAPVGARDGAHASALARGFRFLLIRE